MGFNDLRAENYHAGLVLPRGVELAVSPLDPAWQAARMIEALAFIERGYFTSMKEYDAKYQQYDDAFFLAAERDDHIVGSVRVLEPRPRGFMTINDALRGELIITDEGWRLLGECDLENGAIECNIAVNPAYRGGSRDPENVSNILVAGAVAYLLHFAARSPAQVARPYFIVSFDKGVFTLFRRMYGEAVQALGPSVDYLGSETVPTRLDALMMYDSMLRRRYDKATLGGQAKNES